MKYVLWIETDDGERMNTEVIEFESVDMEAAVKESFGWISDSASRYGPYNDKGKLKHNIRSIEVLEVQNSCDLSAKLEALFAEQIRKENERLQSEFEKRKRISDKEEEALERAELKRLTEKYGTHQV